MPSTPRRLVALALFLGACRAPSTAQTSQLTAQSVVPPRRAVTFPDGWRFKSGEPAAFGERFMIASNQRLASDAGSEVIRAGGNAVDEIGRAHV